MADTIVPTPEVTTEAKTGSNKGVLYLVLGLLFGLVVGLIIGVVAYLLVSNNNNPSNNLNNTDNPDDQIVTPESNPVVDEDDTDTDSDSEEQTIQVFFSKSPDSNDDPSLVFPVSRNYTGDNKITAAMTELLKGPTAAEKAAGYFSKLSLSGESNCGGSSYKYVTTATKITLTFCKNVAATGVIADGQAKMIVAKTLEEATAKTVVILDKNGNCLFDLSGMNVCLEQFSKHYLANSASTAVLILALMP